MEERMQPLIDELKKLNSSLSMLATVAVAREHYRPEERASLVEQLGQLIMAHETAIDATHQARQDREAGKEAPTPSECVRSVREAHERVTAFRKEHPLIGDLYYMANRILGRSSQRPRRELQPTIPNDFESAAQWKLRHPVQDMNGDADLVCPTLILARAQPVTDDLLVAPDGGLNAAPFVVAGYPLPPDPACLSNAPEMAVALGWLTRRRCTGYRRRTRRHDDRGLRLVVRHSTIDAILVVGAIAGERRDGASHLGCWLLASVRRPAWR